MPLLKKITFCFFLLTIFTFAQGTASQDSLSSYLNKVVIVKGVVTQISTPKSGVIYLNLDGKYPDNKLTAVILKRDAENFSDVKLYEGKKVEITGKLQEYKGRLEIVLKTPEQIKLVE